MKNLIVSLAIVAATCFGGSPASAVERTPEDQNPECIRVTSAAIRYSDVRQDSFTLRGSLRPEVPLDFSEGVTGSVWGSPWEIVRFTVAPEDITVTSRAARGRTGDTSFRMKFRANGVYKIALRHKGDIKFTADPESIFDLETYNDWFQVRGDDWIKTKTGWRLDQYRDFCVD